MTPAIDLARRFVAAGAQVPRLKPSPFGGPPALLTPGLADLPEGARWRCPDGLLYEVGMVDGALCLLPVLSDPSWLGWTLAEVVRRGWSYTLETQAEMTPWREYRGNFRSTTALMAVSGDESEEFMRHWPDVCCVRHLNGEPFVKVSGAMSETVAARAAADEQALDRMVEPGTYWVTLRHPTKRDITAAYFEELPAALVAMLEATLPPPASPATKPP